jgi:hypothetical protein
MKEEILPFPDDPKELSKQNVNLPGLKQKFVSCGPNISSTPFVNYYKTIKQYTKK